jgi:hypothetical protein
MGQIYMHGTLNISAQEFPDGLTGLFTIRKTDLVEPVLVNVCPNQLGNEKQSTCEQLPETIPYAVLFGDCVKTSSITRGWILQEIGLSSRTIHFGKDQVYWECQSSVANEAYTAGLPLLDIIGYKPESVKRMLSLSCTNLTTKDNLSSSNTDDIFRSIKCR